MKSSKLMKGIDKTELEETFLNSPPMEGWLKAGVVYTEKECSNVDVINFKKKHILDYSRIRNLHCTGIWQRTTPPVGHPSKGGEFKITKIITVKFKENEKPYNHWKRL